MSNFTKNNGTVLYLNDPGDITVNNSIFLNNYGEIGTCIFYSENFNNYSLTLNNNQFINNYAVYGGGGLFFDNNFYKFSSYINNVFRGNNASYGENFTTSPMRIKIINQKNKNYHNAKFIKIIVIPGITELTLNFQILDYFGKNAYVAGISSIKLMKLFNNKTYIDISNSPLIKIIGKVSTVINNGKFH